MYPLLWRIGSGFPALSGRPMVQIPIDSSPLNLTQLLPVRDRKKQSSRSEQFRAISMNDSPGQPLLKNEE
jgi:hypothetical protein